MSVTVVPRETIENAPSRTLDDALRNVVGLNLPLGSSNTIQPTTNHVSMRGLGGDRALVLLDGVPLNDAVNGYVPWNKAPLGTVERVEVVRGSAASLFGNYAMGGTVSIFSRPLDGSRVEADASYGTFDTKRLSASVTESLGGGWNAGVFLDTEDTDGYTRAIPEERGTIDVPSWSRSVNLQVKAEAKGSSGSRFFVKGNVLDHDLSQGTRLANTHRRMYDASARRTLRAGRRRGLGHGLLPGRRPTTSTTRSSSRARAGTRSTWRTLAENPGQDAGGSLQWSRGLNGPLTFLTFGLDVHRASSNDSVVSFDQVREADGDEDERGTPDLRGTLRRGELRPRAPPGGPRERPPRFLAERRSGREETSATGLTTYEDQSTTRLNPRLSIRYELQDGVALRGSVYRGFRGAHPEGALS